MDNATRLHYLETIGIDVWIPREAEDDAPQLLPQSASQAVTTDRIVQSENDSSMSDEWVALKREVAGCTQCNLCESRTQTVFGVGNHEADWMLIGEAPGQHEDLQGEPFVGKAGQLLTEMLRAMGLNRNEVFIANILKCRPPHNRDPKQDEVQACGDYLQRQIALVQPKMILAVGRIAAQQLLKTDVSLSKLRETVHYLDTIPVMVIYHPAFLLRSLSEKRKAWSDLLLAKRVFCEIEK